MNVIIHFFFFFFSYNVFKGSITFKNLQKRLETLFSKTFIFGEFISLGQIKAKRNFLTINLDFWTNFECNKHKLRHKKQNKKIFLFLNFFHFYDHFKKWFFLNILNLCLWYGSYSKFDQEPKFLVKNLLFVIIRP